MGTGYTRNDTTNNIADGNVINAADLDGEFDAIVTALSTSGHTHDGTAAEGGPVTKIGPAQDIVISASIVSPKTDNALDLGTSTLEFKDLFLDGTAHIDTLDVDENANIDGNLVVGGNLSVAGTTAFNGGTVTLGDGAGDSVVFGADINSSIIPNTDSAFDLGSSTQEWRDLFLDGTAHIDTLDVDVNATVAGTLGVTGIATFTDDIIIGDGKTIGSASDVDAITIAANGQLTLTQTLIGTALDISGDIDVDGTTNLDVVDIDGAVDMASTLAVTGIATFTDDIIIGDGKTIGSASDVDAMTIASNGQITLTQTLIGTALDISGDIDVDGTTNLDVVDIDGAVDMATTLQVDGVATFTARDIHSGGITIANAGQIGSVGDPDAIAIASDGVVTLTQKLVGTELDISGNIDVDGTTNLDVVDIDGAVDMASTLTVAGVLTGASLDISGDIDVDGTSNLDIVDIDGAVNMATTALVTGVLTTTATQVATGGITSGSNIVSDTDSTDDLGTTSVRWANLFVDGITATDQITATGFTGTLDGILGSGAAATASVTTLDTSGVVNLNLATDSTSSTSGALIVDGGVGIAKKLFVGTDLDVDGTTNLDIVDIDGAVNMASTLAFNAASSYASAISIRQASNAMIFSGGTDGYFFNRHDNSATDLAIAGDGTATFNSSVIIPANLQHAGDSDTMFQFSAANTIRLVAGNVETFKTTASEVSINDGGANVDFRVESNSLAHFFYIDGGTNSGRGHITMGDMGTTDTGNMVTISSPTTNALRAQIAGNGTAIELVCTDSDANAGPNLDLRRIATGANNDVLGFVRFMGGDNGGNVGHVYAQLGAKIQTATHGSEDGIFVIETLIGNSAVERVQMDETETVFNKGATDLNFRVASDDNANMIHVDAGDDIVGIGRVPSTSDGGAGSLQIEGSDGLAMRRNGQTNSFLMRPLAGSADGMRFTQGGTGDVMTIDTDGNLLVGTTSASAKITSSAVGGTAFSAAINASGVGMKVTSEGSSNTMTALTFRTNSGAIGSITCGSATAYNTSSDYRLKENVVYDWDATTRLKQLKPARFNWIADDTNTTIDGFLAHEAQAVVPECVTGTKDEVDDDGVAVIQGIDQSKLVPLLVKTILELEARITALEA